MQPSLSLVYSSSAGQYGGIADGWTLPIPTIQLDTSYSYLEQTYMAGLSSTSWQRQRFTSSLSGDRPFVRIDEGASHPDVLATYRAQSDDGYIRYERMAAHVAYRWRALAPNGVTHYFGDGFGHVGWTPLTRTVDAYGNTITYSWSGSRISTITYTSNPTTTPNLAPFATILFDWASVTCENNEIAVTHDPRLDLTRSGRLQKIRIYAHAPGASWSPAQHTREISLTYDEKASSCTDRHGPFHQLIRIQESAWGDTEPRVDLPPVTFEYNRLERSFDQSQVGVTTVGSPDVPTWGTRSPGRWPTVEAMLLDFDGDGRPDRLRTVDDPSECRFVWHRNLGRQPTGEILFGPASPTITLPRLPWALGAPSGAEGCSLSSQHTLTHNMGSIEGCEDNPGSNLVYRWLDMTGDGRPDLVTAIHHSLFYNPNLSQPFGPWPSCDANVELAACPILSDECVQAAITCPVPGNFGSTCYYDDAEIADCFASPTGLTPCGNFVNHSDPDPPQGCLDACFDSVEMRSEPGGDCHDDQVGCYERCRASCSSHDQADVPVPGQPIAQINCELVSAQVNTCGGYPWLIYENLGGTLSQTPEIKYQPIPLESDSGDSSFGGDGFSSTTHALQDFDGDGDLDGVVRGSADAAAVPTMEWWFIFLNDGEGNLEPWAPGHPYFWLAPRSAPLSLSCTTTPGSKCYPLFFGEGQRDNFDVYGLSTLMDLTGDGLPDLTWKYNLSQFDPGRNALPTWDTVSASDAVYLYRNGGLGFSWSRVGSLVPITDLLANSGAGVQAFSRSHYDSTISAPGPSGFSTAGVRVNRASLRDLDVDGRPDLVESTWDSFIQAWTEPKAHVNIGGRLLLPQALPLEVRERAVEETRAFEAGVLPTSSNTWAATKSLIDLDGDGLVEAWHASISPDLLTEFRDGDSQPLRRLRRIENGRGRTIDVIYAATSTADTSVVIQAPAAQKALPESRWVVQRIETKDRWDADVGRTDYQYTHPVWNQDDEGRWGFRGFEAVTATLPSQAKVTERYDYTVDWSGRLKTTLRYPAGPAATPHTIEEMTWAPYQLFGGALKTFHATAKRTWTCSNSQTETACRAYPSSLGVTLTQWAPQADATSLPRLYVKSYEFTQDSEVADDGDRYTFTGYALLAESGLYRLQPTTKALLQYQGAVPTWQGYEVTTFDAGNRHATSQRTFFGVNAGSPDYATSAVTTWDYLPSGPRMWQRLPNQQPAGPREEYTYEATQRFVVSTSNQRGHVTTAEYEPGTGAQLWQAGPNQVSCGAGCVNTETRWTDVDGLGRPIATHVNRSNGGAAWVKTKIGEAIYTDSMVGGTRTKVVERALVSYTTGQWTETETQLDGRGRPVVVNVKTGASSPVATTTYDYDHRGHVVTMTAPDPSASPGQVAYVTYTNTYDSLGRPTSMRRPAVGAVAAGIDLSYDGTRTQADEVAGSEGGPVGRKVTIVDAFGRLTEVREYTDLAANTYATTYYQYDAGDRVRRIQNADGVITELTHDFAGRRTSILRAGRTWKYTYDKNGNLLSEAQPAPSILEEAEYTNLFQYDELNRVTQRQVGGRSMTGPDRTLLGIGTIALGYDTCTNGVGRLCSSTHPSGVLTVQYGYDPEGNRTSEAMTFSFGGVTGTRSTSSTFTPSGLVQDTYYADNAAAAPNSKTRSTITYDDRGLPSTLTWTPASGGTARTVAAQTRNVGGLVTSRTATLAGVGANWRNFGSAFTYDKIGRVTGQTVTSPLPSTTYASQALTYFGQDDPATLAHTIDGTTYTFSYGYSPRHELLSTAEAQGRYSAAFTHTAGGKLATATVGGTAQPGGATFPRNVSYQYAAAVDPEAPSALINIGSATELRGYSYDSAGSQTEVRAGGSATDRFVYDGEDQLRRAQKLASGSVTGTEEYYYDADGNRRGVVTRNAAGAVTGARVFIGGTELELTSTGALSQAFAYLSLGTPVAKIVSPAGGWTASSASNGASVIELQYHGLANNTLLSVGPTGTVRAGFVYGPYGDVIRATGASTTTIGAQRRRFNDKFRDDLTGLSYYGVRYYDPLLLSWTQADPMYRFVPDAAWAEPRRGSLYLFAAGNPLRYLDPDGRDPLLAGAGAAGGGIGLAVGGPPGALIGVAVGTVVGTIIAGVATVHLVRYAKRHLYADRPLRPLLTTPKASSETRSRPTTEDSTTSTPAQPPPPGDCEPEDQTADFLADNLPVVGEMLAGALTEQGARDGDRSAKRRGGQKMTEGANVRARIEQLSGLGDLQAEARRQGVGDATVASTKKSQNNLRYALRRIRCQEDYREQDDDID